MCGHVYAANRTECPQCRAPNECPVNTRSACQWLVLVYGWYSGGERGRPRVVEVCADSPDDLWERLRDGALGGGDKLDDLRLDAGLDSTTIAVFKVERVPFPHLERYCRERRETETANAVAAEMARELELMRTLAEKHGYRCEKGATT